MLMEGSIAHMLNKQINHYNCLHLEFKSLQIPNYAKNNFVFFVFSFSSSAHTQIGHNGTMGIGQIEFAWDWRCDSPPQYPNLQPSNDVYKFVSSSHPCAFSIRNLYRIPYWRHCDATSTNPDESYYWFRMWNNPNSSGNNSDPVLCCDHDHNSMGGPQECYNLTS